MARAHDPNKKRIRDYKRKYGINIEYFEEMLEEQKHTCKICGTNTPRGRHNTWHIDHCHITKKVRGLLCHNCNIGLGNFNDDIKLMKLAIKYLKEES